MAVPIVVIKALATASTSKTGRHAILIIIAAVCMPIILLVCAITMLLGGTGETNKSLVEYSFTDAALPSTINAEIKGYVEDMRDRLKELDDAINGYEKDNENCCLDENLVRAIFYALTFGKEQGFENSEFIIFLDDRTIDEIDDLMKELGEEFPKVEITYNHITAIQNIYEYLQNR